MTHLLNGIGKSWYDNVALARLGQIVARRLLNLKYSYPATNVQDCFQTLPICILIEMICAKGHPLLLSEKSTAHGKGEGGGAPKETGW